ncbi:hypothetical protein G7Y89_g2258 [Cudoniella acicularis]|uniref:AAA+ ATPase lid domain-containing protein n=1 Tax=Cudoniella acicularis TaxID=354080 RepID=A0A8H4RUI0_9HELO|nr:hypothetical protein G7Y89_g2258 [Cudoniella acicularis]
MSEEAAKIPQQYQPPKDDEATDGVHEFAQTTIADFNAPISRLSAIVALILQLVIIVILIVFNVVTVWIQKPKAYATDLSDTDCLLYLTGTTVLATIIASFTTGQIRRLWFSLVVSTENAAAPDRMLGHARTVIGLASLWEEARHFSATASFWLVGLITAAIVAGISATNFPLIASPVALLALDHTSLILTGPTPSPCFDVTNSSNTPSGFIWQLRNGSYISLNISYTPGCESQNVLPAFWNVKYTPQGDVYWMGGVPVGPLAAGVPYATDFGFDISFGLGSGGYGNQIGLSLLSSSAEVNWISQCFPVVATNPVSCRKSGKVTSFQNLNTTIDAATVAGVCTDSSPNIGTATVVIGSINGYASDLNDAIDTGKGLFSDADGLVTISVACTIDIASSLGFRLLNFSRIPPQAVPSSTPGTNNPGDTGYPFHVTAAGNYCTPISPQGPLNISQFLTASMLATGGSAAWQLLTENQYTDGRLSTLMNNANNVQPIIGQTFAESQNFLEDCLGQASAIALGLFWGYSSALEIGGPFLSEINPIDPNNVEVYIVNGNASLEGIPFHRSVDTTNRDNADHRAIPIWRNLKEHQRRQIWRNFFEHLKNLGEEESIDFNFLVLHMDDLAKYPMNGRQIRNSITTARQLAKFMKKMTFTHLNYAISVAEKFDKYLVDVRESKVEESDQRIIRRYSDDYLARVDQI